MQPLARLGYTAATCALLVATFAIIGPRVVHAVAATLVRDEDNPARHTFVAVCGFASTSGSTVQCDYQVPAGEEVVIQTAWVHAIASAANTSILNTVQSVSKGATPIESSVGTNNGMTASETDVQTTMSSTLYGDPGTFLTCSAQSKGDNPSPPLSVECILTGYYVLL
jgi:hypothetical protein